MIMREIVNFKGKAIFSLQQNFEEGEPICNLVVEKDNKLLKKYIYDACGNMLVTNISNDKNVIRVNIIHARGNSEAIIYLNSELDLLGFLKKYYAKEGLYNLLTVKKSKLPYVDYNVSNEEDLLLLSMLHDHSDINEINIKAPNILFAHGDYSKIIAQANLLDLNICKPDSSPVFYCKIKNKVANLCFQHTTNELSYRYGTSDDLDIELINPIRDDSHSKYEFKKKNYTYRLNISDNKLSVLKNNHEIFTSNCKNDES